MSHALARLALIASLYALGCAPPAQERAGVELDGYVPADAASLRAAGWRTRLERADVALGDLRIGPIARAAFVPIEAPRYAVATEVELDPAEPVLVHRSDAGSWAWPLAHLVRRELVLDELAGLPVAVSYCSLCASARAFDRRLEGVALELAVSGLLLDGNSLLYDRGSESLWRQLDGLALVGRHAGRRLEPLATITVSFGALRAAHPQARVMLAPEPGHDPPIAQLSPRQIARDQPPRWLRTGSGAPFAPMLRLDAGADVPVVGAAVEQLAGALVLRERATSSPGGAHEAPLGSAAAFRPEIDGRALQFELAADGARDRETGSRWNLLGEAVAGPLAGRRLEPLPQVAALRFALESAR